MHKIKVYLHRLFFYSSRQLFRRYRSYLSIFLTSVVLLSLVMTFLEITESWFIRDIQSSESGYHHIVYRGSLEDYSPKIATNDKVESVWCIPYTSLMASSDDASVPARLVVPTEEIEDHLEIQYVWGAAPVDGEIAVSAELYEAYTYLNAGVENELYFKATEMTYFPLTVSGIFTTNDREAGYVFVTEATANAIDAETHAGEKYDIYIRCKYASEANAAVVIDEIFRDFQLPDTQWQSRRELVEQDNRHWYYRLQDRYEAYLNTTYLDYIKSQNALPVIAISMPVILVAAMMMASFMANWVASHAEEYGILGALGANRHHICFISAGQILLIGVIAAIPVVIVSAGISNIYISAFNAASISSMDYIFTVPWLRLVEAALWWCILACFFTYIGIARITAEMPYVLLSGQAKYKIPFVARSSDRLRRSKDKIGTLALVKAKRNMLPRIVTAVITSLVCIVCGVFVVLLVAYRSQTADIMMGYTQYVSDLAISKKTDTNIYGREVVLDNALLTELLQEPMVAEAGFYDCCDGNSKEALPEYYTLQDGESITLQCPFLATDTGKYIQQTIYTMDEVVLHKAIKAVLSGEPDTIFTEPNSVIAVVSPEQTKIPQAGETIAITGSYTITQGATSRSIRYGETQEYTICAVVLPIEDLYTDISISGDTWIMSNAGRQLCGLSADTWDHLLAWFSADASKEELRSLYENLTNTPSFMRYDVTASTVQTASEERIQRAVTSMLSVFFILLYLSFCTMTFTDSFLKTTGERKELSILRQLGADDRQIHKTTRSETYPASILAICITLALVLIIPTTYILTQTAWIRALGTEEAFPDERIETMVDEIIHNGLVLYTLFLPAFPIHFLSIGITDLGTYLSTKRILKETIADGIRKDTD